MRPVCFDNSETSSWMFLKSAEEYGLNRVLKENVLPCKFVWQMDAFEQYSSCDSVLQGFNSFNRSDSGLQMLHGQRMSCK